MVSQLPQVALVWSLSLVALGFALLLVSPFLARYHARRRHLDPRSARWLRNNLLYNGTATMLGGALNFLGQGIAGWLFLVSVIVVTLTVNIATNRPRST